MKKAIVAATAMLVLLFGARFALPAIAQTTSKPPSTAVMKKSDVTEAALVEALTPPPPTTRSFSRDPGGRPAAKPKSAQASLLIEFETNSTELTSEARQQLDIVGRALNTDKLAEFNFVLEGHADPRGTSEWNQTLSEGRADAVRRYLVQTQNVNGDRLKPIGKGDREPLNLKNPAAPENRRVTILTVVN